MLPLNVLYIAHLALENESHNVFYMDILSIYMCVCVIIWYPFMTAHSFVPSLIHQY